MFQRYLSLSLLMLIAGGASAAPVQLLFPDASYTPGTPFTFSIEMPSATNLGSYQFDILLSGSSGTAGVDYGFDLGATDAASSGYVFPSTTLYFDSLNLDSPMVQRLTLTDFDFAGLDVIPGTNSAVASIFVNTLGTFSGDLNISVDAGALILDTPDLTPTPISEFGSIQADTFAAASATITAVPEPSSILPCVAAGTAFFASQRRPKRGMALRC